MMSLPPLPATYDLTAAQITQFREQGFVILRGLLNADEVAAYRAAIKDAATKTFEAQDNILSFEGAFQQAQNLRLQSEVVAAFCLSPRLGAVAAGLLGADAVRVYHDQALFKPGHTGPSYWHQDQYFWPLDTPMSLGLWMPLVPITPEMGCMRYAAKSHELGDLGQHTINQESETFFDGIIGDNKLDVFEDEHFAPGDCAFHSGWTIHGAKANQTDTMREAMVVTFYPDGTRVTEFKNGYQEYDAKTFLGGKKPGEMADSPLNPVVWPTS
ncbi:MAG: phytanoyl-CoA dioxygenase family protein [Alphaproteobacteria bacterium]